METPIKSPSQVRAVSRPLRKEHMSRSRGKLQRQVVAAPIAINGRRLDPVEMFLPSPDKTAISHQLYPSHRVKITLYGGGLRMRMPAPLALELYRTGVILQGESQRFSLSIDGREEGVFQVIDFRYDDSEGEKWFK
jgi:hypothetical protein